MPEPKRPLKVFLCHAHADRDPVRGLYTRLTKDGVDVWLDKERLVGGQDWEIEIRKAVRESDVVIVCLSKRFNQAGFRQKEVKWALDTAMEQPEGEIFIIPARLQECENLESLKKWHWVDLFEEDGYEMLVQALSIRAEKIGVILKAQESTLLQTPALHNYQQEPAKVEREESTRNFATRTFLLNRLADLSSYRIKARPAYGVAIVLGLLPIALIYAVKSFDSLVFLACILFFPGVWALAANRRWIFLTALSTFIFSLAIIFLLEDSEINMTFFLTMVVFLTFGFFIDVLLFQVGVVKRFYIKALWSFAAGAISMLVYDFISGQARIFSEYITIYSSFFVGFLVISYIGKGFSFTIRNIWPIIFEDLLDS